MANREVLVKRLNKSLNKEEAFPNLGRWLSTLETSDVMGLAFICLEDDPPAKLKPLVRTFLAAEGLYRVRSNNELSYIPRLGWYALAEYAYRMDWAMIKCSPTMTRDARDCAELTPLGQVMMVALGTDSRVVRLLSYWLKSNHTQ